MKKAPKVGIEAVEYLRDIPIEGIGTDKLEHRSISQTLGDILSKWKHEEGSFTIGLFGSWGTGKSGIGRVLRAEYIDKKSTAIVEFDIWKYESDSFRRQFLLFLNDEDGFDTKLEELNKIYETTSHNEQTKQIKTNKNSLVQLGVPVALGIVGVLLFFTSNLTGGNVWATWVLQTLGGIGTLVGIQLLVFSEVFKKVLDWFFDSAKNLLKVQEITITEHRIEFAEQFERLFKEIIDATLEKGYEKVVIIIDNLDRVSDEKILELLSSVKTFLEYKRVAFLIQCDENAIKRHLLHIYHKETGNPDSVLLGEKYTDEFLRKFFNTYVRIPPLLTGDLDRFTGSLIAQTHLPIEDEQKRTDLLAVISSAHRDNPNPRKIKQFINALVSTYLLAYHREESNKILSPKGIITDNIQMLAKIMIIEQRYSSLYEVLQQEPGLWNVLDRAIIENIQPDDKRLKSLLDNKDDNSLYRFLMRTKFITTTNISPFIYLKQSENSQKISTNAEKLTEALQDADDDKVAELLGQIDTVNVKNFENYIIENIENVKSSSVRVFNIINSVFSSNPTKDLSFTESFYDKIASYVLATATNYNHHIEGFRISVMFDHILPNLQDSYNQEKLAERYVEVFEMAAQGVDFRVNIDADKYTSQLFNKIATRPDLFTEDQQRRISRTLEETSLLNDLNKANTFFSAEQSRDSYIQSGHIIKLLGLITPSDLASVEEDSSSLFKKVSLVLKASSKMNKDSINFLFLKLIEVAGQPNAIGDVKVASLVNKVIRISLEKVGKDLSSDQMIALAQRLRGNYDQNGEESSRVYLATNLLLLREIAVESTGSNLEPLTQYTTDILNSLPTASLEKVLVSLEILNKPGDVFDEYRRILEGRAMSQKDVLLLLADSYEDIYAEPFLARAIKDSGLYMKALEKVKERNSIENKELIGNCILSRAQRENFPQNISLLEVLPAIGFKDESFKVSLITYLFSLLQNQNVEFQNQIVSLVNDFKDNGYLTKFDLEKITELFIEHIERLNISSPGSYIEALALMSLLPMNEGTQNKFAHIIFNQIIPHSIDNAQMMNRILVWAKQAGITYSHNSETYESLYNLLKNKPDNIRKSIANMIVDLGLVDRRSKDFYSKMSLLTK